MKKTYLLFSLLSCSIPFCHSQTISPFNTQETLDAGNIRARCLVHGDMWWDPASQNPGLEFPKGSNKFIATMGALWLGGIDNSSVLHVASQTYRQSGVDFWPGPIDTPGSIVSYGTSQKWAKIWKVSRQQIDSFRNNSVHTIANTPAPILEWPAIGNPYAKGASGTPLTISRPMAPFIDINRDGVYNPLNGDLPLMKGDQMLWWVVNDNGPAAHMQTASPAIEAEVQVCAYAYNPSSIVSDAIFYEYSIRNRGSNSYTSFRAGLFADLDIGYAFNDYAGFDSSRRVGIGYDAASSTTPLPVVGVAMLELPGDSYRQYAPAGSFMTFSNNTGPDGDPTNGQEVYNLMNGHNRAGNPLTNNSHYQFTESEECNKSNLSGDRRFVIASRDMAFNPGDVKKISIALVAASGEGCPNINFTNLHTAVDGAFSYYWNPPASNIATGVQQLPVSKSLIYPNPARSEIFIRTESGMTGSITAFNALGQAFMLMAEQQGNKYRVRVEGLAPGIYTLRFNDGDAPRSAVFVKE